MCSCDRDGLCPACAEREAAEWEPDPRAADERERIERVLDFLALWGVEA